MRKGEGAEANHTSICPYSHSHQSGGPLEVRTWSLLGRHEYTSSWVGCRRWWRGMRRTQGTPAGPLRLVIDMGSSFNILRNSLSPYTLTISSGDRMALSPLFIYLPWPNNPQYESSDVVSEIVEIRFLKAQYAFQQIPKVLSLRNRIMWLTVLTKEVPNGTWTI